MTFPSTTTESISKLVEDQFPEFYHESGPDFIAFLEAYYEWLEQPNNPIGKLRNQYAQYDIDTAANEFLENFKYKYMYNLPPEILGNQRLLQKHVLELYRSKGSQQAIRLLFRLLFNEDIDFYIPSYDIFKLSDNTWVNPRYLEVSNSPDFNLMVNQIGTGSTSGATAIIESHVKRVVNGQPTYLLYISNISGQFIPEELVKFDNIPALSWPKILGSVVDINVVGSSPDLNVGDELLSNQGEFPVTAIVNSVKDGTGSIEFNIEQPGSYYTLDANVSITDHNTGQDANFKINSIKNVTSYQYVNDTLSGYESVTLNAPDYGFPTGAGANLSTIISGSLNTTIITVGEIETLQVLNPGVNYSSNVTISVIDPYTSTSGIQDANGVQVGTNAIISGVPIFGSNLANSVTVLSSGYGNIDFASIPFYSAANNQSTLTGSPVIGAVGFSQGYYDNSKSFLSADKYLFDGHYYQDFSYVIRSIKTLDKYIEVLKDLVHPAGNAVYGDTKITVQNNLSNIISYATIKIQAI